MDNFTHSIVGLAVGEIVQRTLPETESQVSRRPILLMSAWAASNFPDVDLALAPLLKQPLGYLLLHRGHTHTLQYLIPQALVLAGVFWLWPSVRQGLRQDSRLRWGLGMCIVLGLFLHGAMDYLNSYGVHPLGARWYFGDAVFIVEPWFWVTMGAAFIATLERRNLRWGGFAAITGLCLLATASGFLAWASLFALSASMGFVALLQRRATPRGLTGFAIAALLLVAGLALQMIASQRAKQMVTEKLKAIDPQARVLDIAATAFPSNPACWIFQSLSVKDQQYEVRSGLVSVALVTPQQCPRGLRRQAFAEEPDSAVATFHVWTASLEQLQNLHVNNCHLRAWMRYARIPLVDAKRAHDMRFESIGGRNFTELQLSNFENEACPRWEPAWTPPRKDLIETTL